MSNFNSFKVVTGGLQGSNPSIFTASTPDNLAAVTTAGYLNDKGNKVKLNDIFFLNYADTSTFPLGEASTLGIFRVTFTGGNTSLVQTVTTT